jgi:hypothetical protein
VADLKVRIGQGVPKARAWAFEVNRFRRCAACIKKPDFVRKARTFSTLEGRNGSTLFEEGQPKTLI